MRYIPLILVPFAFMLCLTYALSDNTTGFVTPGSALAGLGYAVLGFAALAVVYWLIIKVDSFHALAVWVGTAALLFVVYGVTIYLTNPQKIIDNKDIIIFAWCGVVSLGLIGLSINALCLRKSLLKDK